MGTVISNLKARFGVDTKDFKNGLKDGEKATDDFKNAAGSSIEKLADIFGVNMSAVNGALDTTQRTLNFVGQSFKAGASGGEKFAIAMKVVKSALIATGVGALVVALGSLVAYFTKSGRGADQFAVIMAKVRSVIDNVISRLATFGEGMVLIATRKFKEGWEKMSAAVKGFGEEIKNDWKLAGDLAKREDELFDRETALIVSLEERRQKVEELKLAARDLDRTEKEQQKDLQDAMAITRTMTEDEIALETERLAIMKEKLALAAKDPTDEQLREIAEQEAKLSQLRAQGASEIRGLSQQYNTLTTSINKAAEAEKKLAEETEKAWQTLVTTAKPETPVLFDIEGIKTQLAAVNAVVVPAIDDTMAQINAAIEGTLENMIMNLGEFLGTLALGDASMKDFLSAMLIPLADFAITVGKIAIAAGVGLEAIKASFESMNPVLAIAAGVALIALGTLVKGALSKASGGASGASVSSGGSEGGGGTFFDTRGMAPSKSEPIEANVKGTFVVKGKDLVAVIEQETGRKNSIA